MYIYTSQDRTPYTYFIRWNDLDLNYYGRRTAKGCHPEEFFISYFTSSNYVTSVIAEHGMPDVIKIHKIFSDVDSCKFQEELFLKRVNAAKSLNWLNQTNGDKNWDTTNLTPSKKTIDKANASRALNYTINGHHMKNPDIKNKVIESKKITDMKRYGGSHMSIPEIQLKQSISQKMTFDKLYNGNPMRDFDIKLKYINSRIINRPIKNKYKNIIIQYLQTEPIKLDCNYPDIFCMFNLNISSMISNPGKPYKGWKIMSYELNIID